MVRMRCTDVDIDSAVVRTDTAISGISSLSCYKLFYYGYCHLLIKILHLTINASTFGLRG